MKVSRTCLSRWATCKCYRFYLAIAFIALLYILYQSSTTDYPENLSTYQKPLAARDNFEDRSNHDVSKSPTEINITDENYTVSSGYYQYKELATFDEVEMTEMNQTTPVAHLNGSNRKQFRYIKSYNESERSKYAEKNRRVKQEAFHERQSFSLIEKAQEEAITRTLMNIDTCMMASNLTSPALLDVARQNAKLFMEEYGKVVSPHHLDGYVNHCWDTDYYLTLDSPFMKGFIGQTTFKRKFPDHWYGKAMKTFFQEEYSKTYKSSKVCLPNIYLLGFEKSGSTFFWCLLSRIFNRGFIANREIMKKSSQIQANKEPYFWTPFNYKPAMPSAERMAGEYIPMFLKASDPSIQEGVRKSLTMIDGCPSTVLEWPRFTETEPELANYCLLPSALPELFPQSKYLVIMRNPINMMYSAFWWSFHSTPPAFDTISRNVRHDHRRGPQAFHLNTGNKIIRFLNCMNNHPTVMTHSKCTLWGKSAQNFTTCIKNRTHLLSECVANITNQRKFLEAVLHRGIYYVHIRKWLQTVPRERIFFTTLERLTADSQAVLNQIHQLFKGSLYFLSSKQLKQLQQKCRENSSFINYKKPLLKMQKRTRSMLEKFFEPFNELLSELLEDTQYLWKHH